MNLEIAFMTFLIGNQIFISYNSEMYIDINMLNTYAWIAATAISRVNIMIYAGIEIVRLFVLIPFPINLISKWPAMMLAVNRTDNVIGRIINLVSSIITIRGAIAMGDPFGTKWVNISFGFFFMFFIITEANKIIAVIRQKEICAVTAKEYGFILE